MRYLSVCSGIEAATVGWSPLGFTPVGFSEISSFPCELLKYHYPTVPNYGSITELSENEEYGAAKFDILVGGTPCQSFSVAGNRRGLDDERGKLLYSYLRILERKKPTWCVWENVPGVLHSNKGRDFGFFLWALGKLGYGYAYRVLDAQYFGVPQRRRRVFVVGYLRDWRRAAAVLFEPESLRGIAQARTKKRQDIAGTITARTGISRNNIEELVPTHNVSPSLLARRGSTHRLDAEAYVTHKIAPTLSSREHKGLSCGRDGLTGPAVVTIQGNAIRPNPQLNGIGWSDEDISYTLTSADRHAVAYDRIVRRLTPTECERLQGFPDDYTLIPWKNKNRENCPDTHRYKALGNSMAVPVMRWIGTRMQIVDSI